MSSGHSPRENPKRRDTVAGAMVLLLSIITLVARMTGFGAVSVVAAAASIIYFLLMIPILGQGGRIFLLVSVGMLAAVGVSVPDAPAAILEVLDSGCFVITFFVALGTLREASHSSAIVQKCGLFLSRQKPGRRYFALTMGGHLFGLPLSYGAIALLGTMVAARNASEADELVRRLRLRRMLLAIQRGFTTTLTWSPLAMSNVITLSILPGASWESVVPFTLISAFGLAYLGWAMDRRFKPTGRQSSLASQPVEGGWFLLLPIVALVIFIFVAALLLKDFLDVRMAIAVMCVVPVVAIIWIMIQMLDHGLRRAGPLTARRLGRYVRQDFPDYRNEIALLWSAAVIGSAGSLLLRHHVTGGGDILADLFLPVPWLLPVAAAWLVVIAGQLGMNPILSVILLGGLIPNLQALGISPIVMVVAITGGWSVAGASSPFTATTIIVARISETTARETGPKWNGLYSFFSLILISLYCIFLSMIL